MDRFKYVRNIKEISLCKYTKDAEHFVRTYEEQSKYIRHLWRFENAINDLGLDSMVNIYKCYRAALNKFEERSKRRLPEFIYDNIKQFQQTLIQYIVANSESFEYDKIMDIFEFDKVIDMPSSIINEYSLNFSKLIGDRPVHFEQIKFNDSLDYFDSHSLGNFSKDSKLLIKAIRHKQTTFDNKPNTIWDWHINELKSKFNQSLQDIEYNVTKLQNQINALNTVKELCE